MRVRVTSAFVSKFNEAVRDMEAASPVDIVEERVCSECEEPWAEGARKCKKCKEPDATARAVYVPASVPRHIAVEEFLTRLAPDLAHVLKHQLLECLLAEAAGPRAVPTESSVLDTARRDC